MIELPREIWICLADIEENTGYGLWNKEKHALKTNEIEMEFSIRYILDTLFSSLSKIPRVPERSAAGLISNDVLEYILVTLENDIDEANYDFNEELAEELLTIKNSILLLPQTPEPTWEKAPKWAAAHIFTTMGCGAWIYPVPRMAEHSLTFGGWICGGERNKIKEEGSGLQLPIGIDWRTTLQKRPKIYDES